MEVFLRGFEEFFLRGLLVAGRSDPCSCLSRFTCSYSPCVFVALWTGSCRPGCPIKVVIHYNKQAANYLPAYWIDSPTQPTRHPLLGLRVQPTGLTHRPNRPATPSLLRVWLHQSANRQTPFVLLL